MGFAGQIIVADELPAAQVAFGNGSNNIVSVNPTWAVLPTVTANAVITNPSATRNLVVDVRYSCWMVANGSNIRASLTASGGLTIPAGIGGGGATGWGQIVYLGNTGGAITQQRVGFYTCTIPAGAGAVTFAWQAFVDANTGTNQVNYPVTEVIPRYWQMP